MLLHGRSTCTRGAAHGDACGAKNFGGRAVSERSRALRTGLATGVPLSGRGTAEGAVEVRRVPRQPLVRGIACRAGENSSIYRMRNHLRENTDRVGSEGALGSFVTSIRFS